jgi:hypothetical protein
MPETNAGNTNLSSTGGFTNNVTIWSTPGADPAKNGLTSINHNFPSAPADVQSTVNSAPSTSNVNNPGLGVTPPNAGQPITKTGAAGSTGNPNVDLARTVAGQVPGTSITISNPG